jgi:hypothetical protein
LVVLDTNILYAISSVDIVRWRLRGIKVGQDRGSSVLSDLSRELIVEEGEC